MKKTSKSGEIIENISNIKLKIEKILEKSNKTNTNILENKKEQKIKRKIIIKNLNRSKNFFRWLISNGDI